MTMEEENGREFLAHSWLQSILDRSIIFLLLLSMMIQFILVLGGVFRYRTTRRSLNFIIWISYMGADFVATSALGSMIYSSTRTIVYAIWACMLIVHLGGPDTITAYSVPDSSLWRRHGFNMLYEGLVAAYVVYVSAIKGVAEKELYLLSAAFLIFIVGITKYAERTWALWLASPSQIVRSVKPVYNYMKIEHTLSLHTNEKIPDEEIVDVDTFEMKHDNNEVSGSSVDCQYIVAGEECFREDDDRGELSESIVTVKDVWEHEGRDETENYLLCVSHALFKMYKRRFAGLRFHEAALNKTERFFCQWPKKKISIFNVVEMELKFMYDYLFSKSSGTAFSRWGVIMRVVNIGLLGLCWSLIMLGLQKTRHVLHGQRAVTHILMCVAIGLEGFQLGRIIVSDWSMVWLICAIIRQSPKKGQRRWHCGTANLIQPFAKMVGRVRKVMQGKYWQNQIRQLCVVETCLSAGCYGYPPILRKIIGFLRLEDFIKRWYVRAVTTWHMKSVPLDNDSKDRVFQNLKSSRCVRKATVEFDDLKNMLKHNQEEGGDSHNQEEGGDSDHQEKEGGGWEHLILSCHVATTVLEKLDQSETSEEKVKNARWSVIMSRYFAYLLVTCPDILGVEAENANKLYRHVFWEINDKISDNDIDKFFRTFEDSSWGNSPTLQMAKTLVTDMLKYYNVEDRWNLWSTMWLEMLFWSSIMSDWGGRLTLRTAKQRLTSKGQGESSSYGLKWVRNWLEMLFWSGISDKSAAHGMRLTVGGEFLSQVWVLMGHLGWAEESYIPTAEKMPEFRILVEKRLKDMQILVEKDKEKAKKKQQELEEKQRRLNEEIENKKRLNEEIENKKRLEEEKPDKRPEDKVEHKSRDEQAENNSQQQEKKHCFENICCFRNKRKA